MIGKKTNHVKSMYKIVMTAQTLQCLFHMWNFYFRFHFQMKRTKKTREETDEKYGLPYAEGKRYNIPTRMFHLQLFLNSMNNCFYLSVIYQPFEWIRVNRGVILMEDLIVLFYVLCVGMKTNKMDERCFFCEDQNHTFKVCDNEKVASRIGKICGEKVSSFSIKTAFRDIFNPFF